MSPPQLALAPSPEPSEQERRPQVQPQLPTVRGKKDIHWEWASALLARGHSVSMVAQQLRISRTTLWKALKESPELRRMVAAEQAEMAIEAGAPLHALRNDVTFLIREKLQEGDTRVLLWLANKLGIVAANYLNDKQVSEAEPKPLAEDAALGRLAEAEWAADEEEKERTKHFKRFNWTQPRDPEAEAAHKFGDDWAVAQEHAADQPGRIAEVVTGESDIMRAYREKAEKEEQEARIREHDKFYREVNRGVR